MQILTNGRRTAKKTKKLPSRIKGRRKLPSEIFVFPEERSFPIPDAHHAGLALSALMRMAGRHGVDSTSRVKARKVLAAVKKRFPGVYAGEADIVAAVKRRYRLRAIYSSSPSPSFFTLLSKMIEKYD
jgi:hypothetical protein